MNLLEIVNALNFGSEKSNSITNGNFFQTEYSKKLRLLKESDQDQEMIKQIYQAGNKYLEETMTVLPFSLFNLFQDKGSRKEYEKVYFDRRGRLSCFAVLTMLEPEDDSFISGLEDTLWAICNEYTWALPAHLSSESFNNSSIKTSNRNNIKSVVMEHKYTIDLFSAETAFALSEIIYLLKNDFSPLLCLRVEEEVFNRVIKPFLNLSNTFHWELLAMNWAAVCAGSIGAAAIYMIEDSRLLANIIKRILSSMEIFISGFTDDGACQEGLGYWNYGFGFYTYFAELLKDRTAGQIDIMNDDKIKEIALFQQRSYLSADKVISFSDSPRHVKFHAGLSSRLNSIYSEFELPDISYKAGFNDDKCYRWPHIIRDLLWYTPEAYQRDNNKQVNKKYSLDFLEESQWLIYKLNEKGIVFAAKGGNNAEPHNHNDIGSFIYHVGKVTFLTDLGSGEYTKDYFGPGRYDILCNGSQGHSLPIVEGEFQQGGINASAKVHNYECTEEKMQFSINIGSAYNCSNLEFFLRNFCLNTKDNSLIIEDIFQFTEKPVGIIERFITLIRPKLLGKGTLRLETSESFLDIIFDSEQLKYSLSTDYHVNHDGGKERVYLMDFSGIDFSVKDSIKIVFKPSFK